MSIYFFNKYPKFINQQEQYDLFIEQVDAEINTRNWGTQRDRVWELLMCHYLSLTSSVTNANTDTDCNNVVDNTLPSTIIDNNKLKELDVRDDGFKVVFTDGSVTANIKNSYNQSSYGIEYKRLIDEHDRKIKQRSNYFHGDRTSSTKIEW